MIDGSLLDMSFSSSFRLQPNKASLRLTALNHTQMRKIFMDGLLLRTELWRLGQQGIREYNPRVIYCLIHC